MGGGGIEMCISGHLTLKKTSKSTQDLFMVRTRAAVDGAVSARAASISAAEDGVKDLQ